MGFDVPKRFVSKVALSNARLKLNDPRLKDEGFKGCRFEIDYRQRWALLLDPLCTVGSSRQLCFQNWLQGNPEPIDVGPKTVFAGGRTLKAVSESWYLSATALFCWYSESDDTRWTYVHGHLKFYPKWRPTRVLRQFVAGYLGLESQLGLLIHACDIWESKWNAPSNLFLYEHQVYNVA